MSERIITTRPFRIGRHCLAMESILRIYDDILSYFTYEHHERFIVMKVNDRHTSLPCLMCANASSPPAPSILGAIAFRRPSHTLARPVNNASAWIMKHAHEFYNISHDDDDDNDDDDGDYSIHGNCHKMRD